MADIAPPPPSALKVLRVIANAIAAHEIREGNPETFLSYSEALSRLNARSPKNFAGGRLRRLGLKALDEWTARDGRLPKIASLIVNKHDHRPSPYFFEFHGRQPGTAEAELWWLKEADKAINYNWLQFLDKPVSLSIPKLPPFLERMREKQATYRNVITIEPGKRGGRPVIRGMRITVGDVLGWLALGMTEREIIADYPELTIDDIRASLAYAAERESRPVGPRFTDRWAGKFQLPQPDAADPRLTFLLERYLQAE
jgi:uncharacterized protein (DUF433 family)